MRMSATHGDVSWGSNEKRTPRLKGFITPAGVELFL